MSFKRTLSVSPSPKQVNRDKVWRQSKNSSKLGLCQVCGDKASIINYGALSCQSCKTFFRRNALHPEVCSLWYFYLISLLTVCYFRISIPVRSTNRVKWIWIADDAVLLVVLINVFQWVWVQIWFVKKSRKVENIHRQLNSILPNMLSPNRW